MKSFDLTPELRSAQQALSSASLADDKAWKLKWRADKQIEAAKDRYKQAPSARDAYALRRGEEKLRAAWEAINAADEQTKAASAQEYTEQQRQLELNHQTSWSYIIKVCSL